MVCRCSAMRTLVVFLANTEASVKLDFAEINYYYMCCLEQGVQTSVPTVQYSSVLENYDTGAEVTEFAMMRGNNV